VLAGSAEVLALPEALHFGGWLGLLMLAGVAWLLYRLATRQSAVGTQ
jgi:amino acid permease